jgi:hypothetical protein
MTNNIERKNFVGPLLKVLLKEVDPIVGSRCYGVLSRYNKTSHLMHLKYTLLILHVKDIQNSIFFGT